MKDWVYLSKVIFREILHFCKVYGSKNYVKTNRESSNNGIINFLLINNFVQLNPALSTFAYVWVMSTLLLNIWSGMD